MGNVDHTCTQKTGIFTYIYHTNQPLMQVNTPVNHGSYGYVWLQVGLWEVVVALLNLVGLWLKFEV